MATLSRQTIDQDGLTPAYASADVAGDKTLPGANVYVEIVNGSGSSITVTFATPGTVKSLAVADQTVTIAAGARAKVALDPDLYANRSDSGLAAWTYSAVTTVTVGVFAR